MSQKLVWMYLYAEYQYPEMDWKSFGSRFRLEYLEDLHQYLGGYGVDNQTESIAGHRGLPKDLAYEALDSATITVMENQNRCVYPPLAEQWVKEGKCVYVHNTKHPELQYVTNPNYKCFSWATLPEFEQALKDCYFDGIRWTTLCDEALALLAALRELEYMGNKTRVVFWYQKVF